jgi:hypothetical protein
MELNPSEKRHVWLKGALKSGLKAVAVGLVTGLIAATAIYTLVPATLFGASMASVTGFVTASSAFSPLPLMVFNSFISGAIGLFTGGGQAVEAYHQSKHNRRDEAKLMELDGRIHTLEQTITPSRNIQKIIENGPRQAASFQTAEAERAPSATGPTLH